MEETLNQMILLVALSQSYQSRTGLESSIVQLKKKNKQQGSERLNSLPKGTQLGHDRARTGVWFLTNPPLYHLQQEMGKECFLGIIAQCDTIPMQETSGKGQRIADSALNVQEWEDEPIILYTFRIFLIMLFTCRNRADTRISHLKILYTEISKQTT